jgi:hypothetical protein
MDQEARVSTVQDVHTIHLFPVVQEVQVAPVDLEVPVAIQEVQEVRQDLTIQ